MLKSCLSGLIKICQLICTGCYKTGREIFFSPSPVSIRNALYLVTNRRIYSGLTPRSGVIHLLHGHVKRTDTPGSVSPGSALVLTYRVPIGHYGISSNRYR